MTSFFALLFLCRTTEHNKPLSRLSTCSIFLRRPRQCSERQDRPQILRSIIKPQILNPPTTINLSTPPAAIKLPIPPTAPPRMCPRTCHRTHRRHPRTRMQSTVPSPPNTPTRSFLPVHLHSRLRMWSPLVCLDPTFLHLVLPKSKCGISSNTISLRDHSSSSSSRLIRRHDRLSTLSHHGSLLATPPVLLETSWSSSTVKQ